MGSKLFDVHEMKECIKKAAFEATVNHVSIDKRFIKGDDNEPTFYISSPLIKDKNQIRKLFMDTLIPLVRDDCVCHAIVLPAVLVRTTGVALIVGGDWVYD